MVSFNSILYTMSIEVKKIAIVSDALISSNKFYYLFSILGMND